MLPKASRLTTKEFKGMKTRLAYRGAFFDISVSPALVTKYACIISKKRIKRAVDRNRAKRKVYSLVRDMVPTTPASICIYPTKTLLTAPYPNLQEEVKKAFATL